MMSDRERDELVRTKARLAERLFAKDAITQEALERERAAAGDDSAAADEPPLTIRLEAEERTSHS